MPLSPVLIVVAVAAAASGVVANRPFLIGLAGALVYLLFGGDHDSRGISVDKVTVRTLLAGYAFSPGRYRDFSWAWLSRFLFTVGMTLTTSFTLYFFMSRTDMSIAEASALTAVLALSNIAANLIGSFSAGFLSDRLDRRRIFMPVAGAIFAAGATSLAFSHALLPLVLSAFVMALGMGVFGSVAGAIALDVLPERTSQAGRFMAINGFSISFGQALAPLLAPLLLLAGDAAGQAPYTFVYLAAAGLALAAGFLMLARVKGAR